MKKPRPVTKSPQARYPTLTDYACTRRRFLRRLAAGVALGLGAPLAARCTATSGITGSPGPTPEILTVRLPGSGWASAYLMDWDYLTYAVTFTTYDETFAGYFRATSEPGISALASVLASRTCLQVQDPGLRDALLEQLQEALEAHYREVTGDEGTWIESLEIYVDSCQEMAVAGDMEEPSYP